MTLVALEVLLGHRDTVCDPAPTGRKASMDASTRVGDLVRAAAAGDPHGWNGLVERFAPLVWSTVRAYGLSSDEAANAAQTTWLQLAEQLDRIQREHDRVGVWLASTARRESLRLLGVGRRHDAGAPREGGGSLAGAATAEPEREAMLWRVVRDLPEQCRRLLRILSTVPPPTHEEVAAALDLRAAHVGSARAACLEEFRRRMADIGIRAEVRDS
jgi:DNA-directed RNA polymerase specialized sigma24 family protein